MKCDNCKTEGHFRLRSVGAGVWACKECAYASIEPMQGVAGFIPTEFLRDYGNVSSARIRALNSRAIIEYGADGTNRVGTRLPSGKILDKTPDIAP